MPAEIVVFIISIGAIVVKIAGPSSQDAEFVLALEFGRFVTLRTLFG